MKFNFFKSRKKLNEVNSTIGHIAAEQEDHKTAFSMFSLAAKEGNDPEAQYNLGMLYAMGKGAPRDYREAAYWVNRARRNGYPDTEKMLKKLELDFYKENLLTAEPKHIWEEIGEYRMHVFEDNSREQRLNMLMELAVYFHEKRQFDSSLRIFRAMAEFGKDDVAQNNLALYYLQAWGVERNDLAALYWFDKAARQGNQGAKTDRNGILNAYITRYGKEETAEILMNLVQWCSDGSRAEVPRDDAGAFGWLAVAKGL